MKFFCELSTSKIYIQINLPCWVMDKDLNFKMEQRTKHWGSLQRLNRTNGMTRSVVLYILHFELFIQQLYLQICNFFKRNNILLLLLLMVLLWKNANELHMMWLVSHIISTFQDLIQLLLFGIYFLNKTWISIYFHIWNWNIFKLL